MAAKLASTLPGCALVRRGEQRLERIEELAARAAEETILVMSEMPDMREKNNPSFILRSRHLVLDANGVAHWTWQENEMVVEEMECDASVMAEIENDEPYAISAQSAAAKKIASFFGMKDHALAKYYDDAMNAAIEAGGNDNFTITIDSRQTANIRYRWQKLCAKK